MQADEGKQEIHKCWSNITYNTMHDFDHTSIIF